MNRRKFLTATGASAALLAAPAIVRPANAQAVTLRLHHFLPAGSTFQAGLAQPWAETLARQSNNMLRVEIYPSMQLGGAPPQLYDQARDGVVDMVWTLPGNTPGRFPLIETFELPFVVGSSRANSRALAEFGDKHLRNEFRDVHVVAWWAHDPGLVHTISKPVTRMEDLAGLKLRFPTRQAGRVLEALGASVVGMPLPAAPEALQRGTIDGLVIPWEVVPSVRVHELCKFHTEIPGTPGLYSATFVLAMNRRRYDSLPAELKRVLDANSGMTFSTLAGEAWDRAAITGKQATQARGNTIQQLSQQEVARWRERTQPVVDQWFADIRRRNADGEALLAEARALIAKHAAAA